MVKAHIPLIYYPTSVLIVDDDESFLNAFSLRLPEDIPYYTCSQPSKALALIQDDEGHPVLKPEAIISSHLESADHRDSASTLQVNYGQFAAALTNPKRFNQFSCVIVDHTMPEMNGIQFLQHIRDASIQKMMLTGTADEKMALEAHNEGMVNQFYLKNSTGVFNQLIEKLQEAQRHYFIQLSEKFVGLVNNYEAIFCNINLKTIFNQLCAENAIVEHYVKDHEGSLLLVSGKGEAFEMNFFTADEINELTLMAKDSGLESGLLAQLESRLAMPVGIRDWLHLTQKNAPRQATPLYKVPGAGALYYTWQSLGNLANKNREFVSFDYYLGNLWPNYV